MENPFISSAGEKVELGDHVIVGLCDGPAAGARVLLSAVLSYVYIESFERASLYNLLSMDEQPVPNSFQSAHLKKRNITILIIPMLTKKRSANLSITSVLK
tara:strand:- start:383 stop:685 length:303 start_codon:yes stop_codon:yes gene_type:complete